MSNKNFSISYELRDIVWLIHALQIQSNTALMCGDEDIKRRIDYFIKTLKEISPVLCSHEIKDGPMFSCMSAMITAKRWTIYRERDKYGSIRDIKSASVLVEVDDQIFSITRWGIEDSLYDEIKELLVQYAPVTCEYYNKT